jgi:hypothetical protein
VPGDGYDDDRHWLLMSARHRLKASHAILIAAADARTASLVRIEASWKLLDRARVNLVIYSQPHKSTGLDVKSLSTWTAVAAFGDLVITSAALEALLAGGGQTWDMPGEGVLAVPLQVGEKPIADEDLGHPSENGAGK